MATVTNNVVGAFDYLKDGLGQPVSISANATQWKDPATLNGPAAYRVAAYNVAGESSFSNVALAHAIPFAPTCGIPGFTTAFNPVPATSTTDVIVTLNCFDNANNEQTFQVSRDGASVNAAVPPITAAAPSALTFTDPTTLVEATTYTYRITAKNVFGTSAPATVIVTTPVSVPVAPASLTAGPVTASCPAGIESPCKPADVKLTWTDKAFNETGYSITRTGGAGSFGPTVLTGATFTAADVLNATGSTLTYVDTTAVEGVPYTYTVTAFNGVGSSSAVFSLSLPVTAPTIPTGLAVVPSTEVDANGTYVDTAALTWTDNAFNETGYTVSRAVTAPPALVSPAAVVANIPANGSNNPAGIATGGWAAPNPTMSYTDINLADGVTYAYTVAAVNGLASTSSTPAVTAKMPGIVIPAPTNFVARPNRAGSSIGLSWTDNATNELDYLVEERSGVPDPVTGVVTTYSPWANLAGTPIARTAVPNGAGGTVTLNRANVPATLGLLYAFRVSARNVPSDSPYAYVQSNLAAPVLPAAPTLSGGFVQATRMVSLSWLPVAPAAGTTVSYIVNVNGVPVATNNTTYNFRATVAQLTAATPVVVTVQTVARAIRGAGQTAFGTSTSVISNAYSPTVVGPTAPITPTGFAATVSAAGAVTLNWTAVAPAAGTTITYLVSVDGGSPAPAARGVVLTAATTPALTLGSSHTVTVVARAATLGLFTDSIVPATTTVDLTAAAVPNAPATVTLNGAGTTLTWTAPAALTGTGSTNATYTYTVQMTKDAGATWTTLTGTTPIAARTLTVATPVGANYQFRVAAQATRYVLAPSVLGNWTTTTVLNRAPAASTTPVAALTGTLRNLSFSWTNASTNITGFTIQRRSPAGVWSTIVPAPTVTKTGNVYSIVDVVTALGSYTYRVTATSLGGTTAQATSNAITTP
jgi:hypothetical protein